jgi:hypothetical protein
MKSNILFLLLLFLSRFSFSQCGNIFMTQNEVQSKAYKLDIIKQIQESINNQNQRTSADKDTIRIPVVFNVLIEDSIADIKLYDRSVFYEVLDSANKYLNIEYEKLLSLNRTEFHDIVDVPYIQLIIARHNTQGVLAEGIRYKKWTAPNSNEFCEFPFINGQQKAKLDQFGGISAWDTRHYLNFWVGNFRKTSGSCYSGQSTYPIFPFLYGQPLAFMDGVLLQDYLFKGNHRQLSYFSTIIHEMGHYLGLLHIWGGLASDDEKGCNIDDGIKDTPLQYEANYNCNTIVNSCIEANDKNDMCSNTMDYADGITFTKEQNKVMRNAALNIRKDLSIPKVAANLVVSKYEICKGEIVTLKWNNTASIKSDYLYSSWSNVDNNLSQTIQPNSDTVLNLFLTNAYDTVLKTIEIKVIDKPTASYSISDTITIAQNISVTIHNATQVSSSVPHTFEQGVFNFQAGNTTDSFYIFFKNNCFEDSVLIQYIFNDIQTKINNNSIQQISIYPNPSYQKIYVQLEKQINPNIDTYYIFDTNGKIVAQNNLSQTIDVSQLNTGNYILLINNNNTLYSSKFLKK